MLSALFLSLFFPLVIWVVGIFKIPILYHHNVNKKVSNEQSPDLDRDRGWLKTASPGVCAKHPEKVKPAISEGIYVPIIGFKRRSTKDLN